MTPNVMFGAVNPNKLHKKNNNNFIAISQELTPGILPRLSIAIPPRISLGIPPRIPPEIPPKIFQKFLRECHQNSSSDSSKNLSRYSSRNYSGVCSGNSSTNFSLDPPEIYPGTSPGIPQRISLEKPPGTPPRNLL